MLHVADGLDASIGDIKNFSIMVALFVKALVTNTSRLPTGFEAIGSTAKSVRLEVRIILNVCGRSANFLNASGHGRGFVYSQLLGMIYPCAAV